MKVFLFVVAGIALVSALPEPLSLEKRVCPHDNLLRCLIGTPSLAVPFCSSSVGIFPTASTIWVTVSPTASVSATSTAYSTATSTSIVSETSTSTTIATSLSTITEVPTITITVKVKRTSTSTVSNPTPPAGCDAIPNKRAPATSLACIKNLNPGPSAVSSACSCFSGSYAPSISPVTSSTTLEPVTVTAATVTTTVPVTVGAVATVTVYSTTTTTTVITVTASPSCNPGPDSQRD
ncbi:hypothetical protein CONLIGDRAFT_133007 [Coniochaeta ligniaria NRRL 30616]|uniref:Extracellular membrane protein CFEM domain-containing protein n=1 Tax=Coniochaeta ligniaria NRRL 30616 TaxID=1408157 RepID=A0A1J7I7R5_9PEZI|nr:hypothetical protein CONLIGDRAFT_133007 [Coniochaeta ligniaria NRRL 30616]